MGDTFVQKAARAKKTEKEKNLFRNGPFKFVVTGVNFRNETYNVASAVTGKRPMNVSHPFTSRSSWIRSMPEPGGAGLMTFRSDRAAPAILLHEHSDRMKPHGGTEEELKHQRLQNYEQGIGVYRPLRPGEHEINSSGYAQTWWSSRPIKETRGGVVRDWLNQDELESGHKAPLHRKVFLNNTSARISDEERTGVVKRIKEEDPTQTYFPKVKEKFTKEHLLRLESMLTPGIDLLYNREGQVIDEDGEQEIHPTTGEPLRKRYTYYTEKGAEWNEYLDEQGNWEVTYPDSAEEGGIFRIPKGSYKGYIGVDWRMTTTGQQILVSEGDGKFRSWDNELLMTEDGLSLGNTAHVLEMGQSTERIKLKHKAGQQLLMAPDGSIRLISPTAVHLESTEGSRITFDSTTGKLIMNSQESEVAGATHTIKSKNFVQEIGTSDITIDGAENKNVVGGCKKNIGGSSGINVTGGEARSVAMGQSLMVGMKGDHTYGLGQSTLVAAGNWEASVLLGNVDLTTKAGNCGMSTLAGNVDFSTIAGQVAVANALGSLAIDIAGGVQCGNMIGGLKVDPAGNPTLSGILTTLGNPVGMVLTTVTAPIIDTITGTPHIGVPTVLAG